jgi:undecaprenyl phosphate-alpha-L-ara4N flippase subunit ArnE
MFRISVRSRLHTLPAQSAAPTVALFAANLLFNIVAHTGFKLSATSVGWRSFLGWQVVGNLAGFLAVLSLTGILRFLPLHVAYPVSAGLAVIGIQVVAARWLFHEPISPAQWLGTALVVAGIVLIGGR